MFRYFRKWDGFGLFRSAKCLRSHLDTRTKYHRHKQNISSLHPSKIVTSNMIPINGEKALSTTNEGKNDRYIPSKLSIFCCLHCCCCLWWRACNKPNGSQRKATIYVFAILVFSLVNNHKYKFALPQDLQLYRI